VLQKSGGEFYVFFYPEYGENLERQAIFYVIASQYGTKITGSYGQLESDSVVIYDEIIK